MTRHQLHSPDHIKNKMPHSGLLRFAQRKSMSITQRLHTDSPLSIGLRVFKDGTNAPSSTARITPAPPGCSLKHGANYSALSALRSCLPSFPTKTCAVSAKRSRRLVSSFCYQKFAASALLIQKS